MTIRLSPRETEAILAAYLSGSSLADLSADYGPSTDWLRGLLRKHGVTLRTRSEAAEVTWHRRRTTVPVMTAWQCNRLTIGGLIQRMEST